MVRRSVLVFGCVVSLLGCGGDDGDGGTAMPTTAATVSTTAMSTTAGSTSDEETSTSDSDPDTSDSDPDTSDSDPDTSDSDPDTSDSDAETTDSDSGTNAGPTCSYGCTAPTDCLVGGEDFGFECVDGACIVPCTGDDGCVAYSSGWLIEPCTATSECEIGTCVTFEGGSGCAFTPDLADCADVGLQEISRMSTEGGTVTVCGEPAATCIDQGKGMECHTPCTAESCGAMRCDTDGFCKCDDFFSCYEEGEGNTCTESEECVFVCTSEVDCPASNFDNTAAACG